MTRNARRLMAVLIAAASVPAFAAEGLAAAFFPRRVAGVSAGDVLMVRAEANASAPILVGYPDDVILSMTGQCTGNVNLDDISGLPHWKQRQIVRSEWCEVWIDPYASGDFQSAWVFGRFIAPE